MAPRSPRPTQWSAQLEQGLAGLGLRLDGTQRERLLQYLDLLTRWSRVYNLTAVLNPREMVGRQLLDRLAVCPLAARRPGAGPGHRGRPARYPAGNRPAPASLHPDRYQRQEDEIRAPGDHRAGSFQRRGPAHPGGGLPFRLGLRHHHRPRPGAPGPALGHCVPAARPWGEIAGPERGPT